MIKDLIVIGSGNPDIVRLIEDINSEKKEYNFIGFVEKDESLYKTEKFGYPILGGDDQLQKGELKNSFLINNVYASQDIRQSTYNQISILPRERFCNLIHPTVKLHLNTMGVGNLIYDFVSIQSKTIIGDHNIIHSASIIGHESIIGDNNLISVNVSLGSRTQIGNFCFFGIGSILLPSLSIVDFTYIGGGAVIFNHVKQKSTLFGNPARVLPQIKNEL